MRIKKKKGMHAATLISLLFIALFFLQGRSVIRAGEEVPETGDAARAEVQVGGGYAVSGQYPEVGYSCVIYDATNGLPTSDANYILGSSDGYIWIAGYSGIIRYDGSSFERLDTSSGLANGRGLFEDGEGRIWVGTNDDGVVVIDGSVRTHITYKEGLPSSSIRVFAEDREGNVFIGTTAGVCYADRDLKIHAIDEERLNKERVLRLDAGSDGTIYGQTRNGLVFAIKECGIEKLFSSEELGTEKLTSILADPEEPGKVYLCTDTDAIYYGSFGDRAENMQRISVSPLNGIHWISRDCGRVWVSSTSAAGFLDENGGFHLIDDAAMNSGIEMMTSDYQGNMWFASSTQGVMKIITNQFVDLTKKAGLPETVTNATCLHGSDLYIGTDTGLCILDGNGSAIQNELTASIGTARVRCITEGKDGDLWIGAYTQDRGLIHYTKDGRIHSYTRDNGMPDNEIRCIDVTEEGTVLAGTNNGLAVIEDNRVTQTVGSDGEVTNPVFLTVEDGGNGEVYIGSDGDGIYVWEDSGIRRIGREEGLTSDVVVRIKMDRERGVFWLVTSNSIEYMKDGRITPVTTFPYNNNYDIYFDSSGNAWVISSCGIFVTKAEDMMEDQVSDYRLYTVENGLTGTPTSLSMSALSKEGNLFIPERSGVVRINIDHFSEDIPPLKASVSCVSCEEEQIWPDSSGTFILPASDGRIRITASVLDYTLLNPKVQVYLEGQEEDGIEMARSSLLPLEYTRLAYGNYTLHIRILDSERGGELLDETAQIVKKPRFTELPFVRFLMFLLVAAAAGTIVWRVMKSTVMNRQYTEIIQAKDEAEKANSIKSTFLASMSNEIRTPINTIVGVNEMTLREEAEGVPKPYFTAVMSHALKIREASETLLLLINDLLDLSRIETGKMHLAEQEYDTLDMLRSVIGPAKARSSEKELKFDTAVEEMLPRRLYGDAGKIKQILLYLLSNAVKFTDSGSVALQVCMVEREDTLCRLRFSVRDTGIGIREEDVERLFRAYEHLGETKDSGIRGKGLGLDISRRFAELMGGSLTCESESGKGTEFILTLNQKIIDITPAGVFAEREDNSEPEPYVPSFIAPDADILVVDDSPIRLSVIKGLLSPTRVLVSTASSGEECLERIKDTHYNVVFLNLVLPGIGGVETVERIRENDPDLPVYVVTEGTAADEAFFRSKGFNGYLTRPVSGETLERILMKHLPGEMVEKPERSC